jgi:hypothetical protein
MSHCFSAAKTCGLKLMSLYNDFHRAETARNPYKDNAACGIFLWKALESPGKMQSLNHCIKKSKLSMSAAARPADAPAAAFGKTASAVLPQRGIRL